MLGGKVFYKSFLQGSVHMVAILSDIIAEPWKNQFLNY
jgi:hypothetical protein